MNNTAAEGVKLVEALKGLVKDANCDVVACVPFTDIPAVSEAVTNCIVHAYREDLGMIYINVKLFENGTIAIRVRDKGCGIENVKKAMEPMFTTAGGERAGLGFAVMESFMDSVKVRSAPGKGTRVTLSKRLGTR